MMELAKVMARKTPSLLGSLPDILKSGWGREDKGDEVQRATNSVSLFRGPYCEWLIGRGGLPPYH